jgi:cytoskeleton protein RodZ
MGLVAILALVVSAGYLWRFGRQHEAGHGIVPFLLGGALLVVSVVHGVAWRESRAPLLIVDLTGLRIRLGGRWTGLPWGDVETVEVAGRGRWGDGRLTVRARDERRVLADAGLRARLAVLLNRWLYNAALVVPYGLSTTVSSSDVAGTLSRLADGRVPVVVLEEQSSVPVPTIEVALPGTLRRDADAATGPTLDEEPSSDSPGEVEPAARDVPPGPRRLAAVVSALRSQAGRLGEATGPIRREPVTIGTLALSDRLDDETEPLPELSELRRRAPEDDEDDDLEADPAEVDIPARAERPLRTANVELIIDATTDLSAQAMRKVRHHPPPPADEPPADADRPPDAALPGAAATPMFDTPPNEVIGMEVRRAREWLAMSVDDLAERTRIRPYVIESIEMGDFSPCGGDFYARGHLRMLASVLGVDPAPIVSSYDAHLASAPVSPLAVFDAELSTGVLRPTGRGGSRWGALVGAVLVLLLVWGVARLFLADQTPGSDSLRAPTSNAARLGSPGVGNTLLLPPAVPPTRVTLSVASGTSRVVVWDKAMTVVYRGVLQSGDAKTLSGPGPLRVMAVDGGAVSLAARGHPKALMGKPGQRVFLHVG